MYKVWGVKWLWIILLIFPSILCCASAEVIELKSLAQSIVTVGSVWRAGTAAKILEGHGPRGIGDFLRTVFSSESFYSEGGVVEANVERNFCRACWDIIWAYFAKMKASDTHEICKFAESVIAMNIKRVRLTTLPVLEKFSIFVSFPGDGCRGQLSIVAGDGCDVQISYSDKVGFITRCFKGSEY
ncbi:hypothetical protein HN446_00520 [bacterium]|jgi:hypothetical protein|nr:hypothetical protein [bacterium]